MSNLNPTDQDQENDNGKMPSGCVGTNVAGDTDFYPIGKQVKNMDECFDIARNSGYLCKLPGSDETDPKCGYIAYRGRDINDILRKANDEYTRFQINGTESNKAKSLLLFKQAWTAMTPDEKTEQLSTNLKTPFMLGYCTENWLLSDPEISKYFTSTAKVDAIPLDLGGDCWIGGTSILQNKDVNIFTEGDPTAKECVGDRRVYRVTSEGGLTDADYNAWIQEKISVDLSNARKNADVAKEKYTSALAAHKAYSANTGTDQDLVTLMSSLGKAQQDAYIDSSVGPIKESIKNKIEVLKQTDQCTNLINILAETSENAINKNITLVNDKQGLANKMNSDIQTLDWSLKESQSQENLYNKITTSLGIIIMLFVGLCVGTMVYYMIKGGGSNSKTGSNSGILNNVFGLNKKGASSSNKKLLNSIF